EGAFLDLQDWGEARERFAEILGVRSDLPDGVLQRAMVDTNFAHRLMVSRNAPGFLKALIGDPENTKYASQSKAMEAVSVQEGNMSEFSSVALLGRAAKSLAKWGATGFTHTSEPDYAHRLETCQSCPHSTAIPDKLVYRMAGVKRETNQRTCNLCGCPVQRKARMSTESCPGEHPDRPGFTRWGDLMSA
ncbi:MAG: hypothetical protein ABJP82_09685, partial [Hyphomicrobiales bacterium]